MTTTTTDVRAEVRTLLDRLNAKTLELCRKRGQHRATQSSAAAKFSEFVRIDRDNPRRHQDVAEARQGVAEAASATTDSFTKLLDEIEELLKQARQMAGKVGGNNDLSRSMLGLLRDSLREGVAALLHSLPADAGGGQSEPAAGARPPGPAAMTYAEQRLVRFSEKFTPSPRTPCERLNNKLVTVAGAAVGVLGTLNNIR
jgi:hypothetical protein